MKPILNWLLMVIAGAAFSMCVLIAVDSMTTLCNVVWWIAKGAH